MYYFPSFAKEYPTNIWNNWFLLLSHKIQLFILLNSSANPGYSISFWLFEPCYPCPLGSMWTEHYILGHWSWYQWSLSFPYNSIFFLETQEEGEGHLEKISTGVLVLFFLGLKFDKLLYFGLLKMRVIFGGWKNKHYFFELTRNLHYFFWECWKNKLQN